MFCTLPPLAQTSESNERATRTFSDSAQVEVCGLTANCPHCNHTWKFTQLIFRLAEGGGEAIYEIGVGDDGSLVGK